LAIIPALVVTCGGDRYAIPQVSLLELVRLEADEVAKALSWSMARPSTAAADVFCLCCTSIRN